MKLVNQTLTVVVIVLIFIRCSEKKNDHNKMDENKIDSHQKFQEDSKVKYLNIASYKQSPEFIRYYLDSQAGGKTFMADSGQNWNSACLMQPDLPNCQFIFGHLFKDQYIIAFKGGGIAPSKRYMVIKYFNNKVLSTAISYDLPSYLH